MSSNSQSLGTPIYGHSSGHTSLDPNSSPITPSNTFRLASATKLITTISALQLVSRGVLSLDDPTLINTHLPELISQPIIRPNPNPSAATHFLYEKREKDITLRQLLTHSSGVGYDVIDSTLQAWRKSRGESPLALSGNILPAFSTPLVFQPGMGWAYGGGLDWAGVLIERVTGLTLGTYMQKHVFEPLGMRRTAFPCQKNGEVMEALVQATMRTGEGGLVDAPTNDGAEGEGGGGGLFGSVEDFVAVLRDVIADEPKLLSKEMVEVMWTPQFVADSAQLAGLKASAMLFEAMGGALTKGTELNHGIGGMLVMEDVEGLGKTRGTLNWSGAFNCPWFANREQGVAAFYASQMLPPGEPKSAELIGGFIQEVWRLVGEKEKK
jgi:CubicO group peptidase (beta-lactamase class C family)